MLVGRTELRKADAEVGDNPLPELRSWWGCGVTDGYELARVVYLGDELIGEI